MIDPSPDLSVGSPGEPLLDPSQRSRSDPRIMDRGAGHSLVLRTVFGLDLALSRLVQALAKRAGIGSHIGREIGRDRVAKVARHIHRLVISDESEDFAALLWRFLLKAHQLVDDLERVRLAVDDIADLNEHGPAAGPVPIRILDSSSDREIAPDREVAVKIADCDDPRRLRLRRRSGCKRRDRRDERGNCEADFPQQPPSHRQLPRK